MRTIRELLQLMLNTIDEYFEQPFCDGLCIQKNLMRFYSLISDVEHLNLSHYLDLNLPDTLNHGYCWSSGKVKPRRKWLQEQINKQPLSFDDWSDQNSIEIDIELAENGADRELDFNPEREYEIRYEKYLEGFTND